MAIRIDFLANVSDLLRGTKSVDDSLDKVSSSLDDVVRDGQQGTQRLESSFRDLAESSKRIDPGTSIGKSMKRGTEEAGEGVETLKENTKSNLKEVAASFDGTAQGAADGFQGLVAEIAEGFGPAGLIAGAVVAGGIGLISTGLQNADANNQVLQQHIADLAGQLIDAGRAGHAGLGEIADELKNLATQTDPGQQSLAKLLSIADRAGESYSELARAYAGNSDGLGALIVKEESHRKALDENASSIRTIVRGSTEKRAADLESASAAGAYTDALKEAKKTTDAAAKAQEAYVRAGGPELQAKADATEQYAESVQSSLQDAGASWRDYQKDQKVNLDKYNDHIEDSIKATEQYQSNVKEISAQISQDALNYILSLGEDAAPLLQQYVDAPKKLQRRTASNWDSLGQASSSAYISALEAGLPKTVKGPKVQLDWSSIPSVVTDIQSYVNARPLVFRTSAAAPAIGKPVYGP